MKRRAIIYLADCEEKRFDNYLYNDRLPFFVTSLSELHDPESEKGKKRADYSVCNAFELRMMLEFTSDGGIDVESARHAAENAAFKLAYAFQDQPDTDVFVALVQFRKFEDLTPRAIFVGTFADIAAQIAEKTDAPEVQRVVMVNASEVSRFVLPRAVEFDLINEYDPRPAWVMDGIY
ncbi:hypothetical protein [Roseicitreum antarcticum]|uniref:Uncharacterized protein n=1 Tax=Roseicitreum antarcticum TaxID=564137 RepID=A0A1H2ZVG8_9RHOB|nr:hypothetical protein [Roseicitreum antarcticum]SDX21403.1 hypothetical protein SAMN04488238_10691 [Roseicitreum antarcticum]